MTTYNQFAERQGVAIPIIQRDYVQGLDSNFTKRDKFLRKILEALDSGKKFEIDFIYGSSENYGGEEYFQPVDGQQRLSTLAIMGWLLNQKAGNVYDETFKKLTYTARPSSEQFCNELFGMRLPTDYESISKYITTEPGWFAQRWKSDPTVQAMLQMLDCLDAMLSEYAQERILEMARRFFTESPVTFELLDMHALNLNDDLYIKMNARGKLLTPFENWKAEFNGMLASDFKETLYTYGKIPDDDSTPTIPRYFEYAIEHEWCDLFWPMAYDRWNALSVDEKRKVNYPRIDELFMNLLDYVSRFIFFASMPNAEKTFDEKKNDVIRTMRDLFDHDRDSSRMSVYDNKAHVETLFRILDNLVDIVDNYGSFEKYLANVFIATSGYVDRKETRVNLFEGSCDLLSSVMKSALQPIQEVMLWAVLQWILCHPESVKNGYDFADMTDYLRIMMGWGRGIRQRQVTNLNVAANIRLSDYHNARDIINLLASAPDVFEALAETTMPSLEQERQKGAFYGTPKFEIVRSLSTCSELYYSFILLIDTMKTANDVGKYIDRFYEFIGMNDDERIRALNAHGFNGVMSQNNHYFYGLAGKWDFIFSVDDSISKSNFDRTKKAFSDYMTSVVAMTFAPDRFAYYVGKYPEFMNAVNDSNGKTPLHYFIRPAETQFTAWAVKTFSTQPIRGYNVDPYGFAVAKLFKGNRPQLYAVSDNSEHGVLYVDDDINADREALWMECVEEGWLIEIGDSRRTVARRFSQRFNTLLDEQNNKIGFFDTKEEFSFDGFILKDINGRDRIMTALAFLNAIS